MKTNPIRGAAPREQYSISARVREDRFPNSKEMFELTLALLLSLNQLWPLVNHGSLLFNVVMASYLEGKALSFKSEEA